MFTDLDKPKLTQATDELYEAIEVIYGELIPSKKWVVYYLDITGEYDSKGNWK